MIAFPSMLVPAAEKAGMAIPADVEDYNPVEFPHWHVFMIVQIGTPMPNFSAHWDNAHVIAEIPADKITTVTYEQLLDAGLQVGFPIP